MGLLASMNCGGWRVSAQRPFIYFNLVRGSLTCISPLRQPFVYIVLRDILTQQQDYQLPLLDKREQHRYRRTQLLGAGGCCRSPIQTGRASYGCAAGTELGQGAGEDVRQMVL
jgi:hypothetical protein